MGVPIKYRISSMGDSVEVLVSVGFQRRASWSLDTASTLLNHEQLHFDISELYGRIIRKRVQELNRHGIVEVGKIKSEIVKILKQNDKRQAQYDRETGHGAVDFMQEKWEAMIRTELRELTVHASTGNDCVLFKPR